MSSPVLRKGSLTGASIGSTPASLSHGGINEADDPQPKHLDNLLGSSSFDQAASEPHDNREEVDQLTGILLGDDFRIGQLLRRDNHSDLYAITREDDVLPRPDVEARVYTTDGIDKKLAQYRRRNMRRLATRSLWRGRVNERTIFIYQKDSEDGQQENVLASRAGSSNGQDTARTLNSGGDNVLEVLDSILASARNGEAARAEAARAKQQRRRARQRETKRAPEAEDRPVAHEDGGNRHSGGDDKPGKNPTLEERTIDILVSLHRAQSFRESTLRRDPGREDDRQDRESDLRSNQALPSYLRADPLEGMKVTNTQELVTLVEAKREEVELLKRLRARLPKLRDKKLQQYVSLCTQVIPEEESADDWDMKKKQALEIYRALDRVGPFIIELLSKVESCHSTLTNHLDFVTQRFSAWSEMRFDEDQELALKKESLGKLLGVLLPHTAVYGRLQAEMKVVESVRRGRDTPSARARKQVTLADIPDLLLKLHEEFIEAVRSGPSGVGEG
ncbi:hypothetical protein DL769_004000 [Monosporascus sp. CRB-8-3]|nr:hypothetical protein DL769_004000 [Monosporascus sp. CRB-8-3]